VGDASVATVLWQSDSARRLIPVRGADGPAHDGGKSWGQHRDQAKGCRSTTASFWGVAPEVAQ
jgi:hypothetical protein